MKYCNAIVAVLLLGGLLMIGCGGGGSGGSGGDNDGQTGTQTYLQGTAAAGVPIAGTVTVQDAAGNQVSVAVGTDGSFQVSVTGLVAPFVLWVQGTANQEPVTLYSMSSAPGRVNISPITDLIMALALGGIPSEVYTTSSTAPSLQAVDEATRTMVELFSDLFTAMGLAPDFNPMSDAFTADSTGFDLVLDLVAVGYDANQMQLVIKDLFSDTLLYLRELSGDQDVLASLAPSDLSEIVCASKAQKTEYEDVMQYGLASLLEMLGQTDDFQTVFQILDYVDLAQGSFGFSCGSVSIVDDTSLLFTFNGATACNGVEGDVSATATYSDGELGFKVEFDSLSMPECTLDGSIDVLFTSTGNGLETVLSYTDLTVCGNALNGGITAAITTDDGQLSFDLTGMTSFDNAGTSIDVSSQIIFDPDQGGTGTATLVYGDKSYGLSVSGLQVDPTCGIPTQGILTITGPDGNTIEADFSNTTCEEQTVIYTINGIGFSMDLSQISGYIEQQI